MSILVAALLAQGWADPPAGPLYREAVACVASASVAKKKKDSTDNFDEILTWGLVMAEFGKKAGRTAAQVDRDDLEAAEPFYRLMKEHRPKAFDAHRAYCKALLP